mgnify:FL=1
MTIAKRLMILLATLMLALAAVGAVGLVQMRTLNENIKFVHENVLPSVVAIDKAANDFTVIRALVLRHILSDDDKDMAAIDTQILEVRARLDKSLQYYLDNYVINDRDKALLIAERDKLKDFYALIEEPLALSRAQQPDKAKTLIEKARARVAATNDAFQEHIKFNIELSDEIGRASCRERV